MFKPSQIKQRSALRSAVVLGSLVLITSQPVSKASLLAYDGFDYAVGNLAGNNGGAGWTSAWAQNGGNTANSQIVGGSLSYMDAFGYSLVTSGNSAFITGDGSVNGDNLAGGSNSSSQPLRILNFSVGTSGGVETTWVSFMAIRTDKASPTPGAPPNDYAHSRASGFQFFYNATTTSTTAGNEQFSFGRGTQSSETLNPALPNDTWGVLQQGNANATVASTVPFSGTPVDFILIRVDSVGSTVNDAANADTIHVWINPTDLNTAPADGTADITFASDLFSGAPTSVNRDLNFDRIRLFAGNDQGTLGSTFTYGNLSLDEIRIGTTFGDVTPNLAAPVPEPSVLGMLGLGGLALARFVRRRGKQ